FLSGIGKTHEALGMWGSSFSLNSDYQKIALRSVVRIEVGVFLEGFAVLIEKLHTDFRADQSFFDFLLDDLFHAALKIVREVLNDGENFLNCCALDYFFDEVIVFFVGIRIDMNLRHAAKQIVNVAQDILISAHKKNTEVIRFTRVEPVQLQSVLGSAWRDEFVHFAIGIARQIDQSCTPRRLLTQALQ